MSLAEFCPHAVCINLDRRADRWRRMQTRCQQIGLNAQRFAACDGAAESVPPHWRYSPGAYGCLKSHCGVIELARQQQWPHVLILEDDVVFADDLDDRVARLCAQLPTDWDAVLLGGIHRDDPRPVADGVVRLTSSNSTYAWIVRDSLYDALLAENRGAARPVDESNRILQRRFRFYGCWPNAAWVDDDFSDAAERRVRHWWLEHSLVLDGRLMAATLERTAALVCPPADGSTAAENRDKVVETFARLSPAVDVLVIEPRGSARQRNGERWTSRRQHIEVAPSASLCESLAAAVSRLRSDVRHVIVARPDVFVPHWDLKSGLLMSHRFDFVMCYKSLCSLDAAEAEHARRDQLDAIRVTDERLRPAAESWPDTCIMSPTVLRRVLEVATAGPDVVAAIPESRRFVAPGWSYQL